jgi:calcium-dependent protein kinase
MSNVSLLLKDLLKHILKPEAERISIDGIYKHPWMKVRANRAPISVDFKTIANFSKFSKMKVLAATYLASQLAALDTQNLERVFKMLDENGDGYLSIEELNEYLSKNKASLNPMTVGELKKLLQLICTGKGKINYTQFLASTISEQALCTKDNLIKVFRMLDIDGNGYVDKAEMLQVLSQYEHLSQENALLQTNEIFKSTDVNSDGKIDFNEFVAVMCRGVD